MNTPLSAIKVFINSSIVLSAVFLISCDSNNDASNTVADNAVELVDFDLSNLDAQEIEASEPGPSLGFALPPNGRIYARSGAIGSTRGNEFELSCSDGKILAGVSGQFSNRLEQLQAQCVNSDDTGRWVGTPSALQNTIGSNNGTAFSSMCATDHAVVGFTSDFANDYPAYLQVHCRKLSGKQTSTGNRVSLAAIGTLNTNAPSSRPQCADQAVATGLYGYAQSAIER